MRDFGTKIDGAAPAAAGVLTAAEDNVRFREEENLVSSAGMELDPAVGPDSDFTMMAQASARYASGGVFYSDSGAANSYDLTSPSGTNGFVMPKDLFEGLEIEFEPLNSNTSASTVNVNSSGVKPLRTNSGEELEPNTVIAGVPVVARYNQATDDFRIRPWALTGVGQSGNTGTYLNNPIYPEVITDNGILLISNPTAGNIEIAGGGRIVHRGWKEYLTDDYPLSDRQFTTVVDRTYHLRWTPANGFALKDLAHSSYNPSSLNETDISFDTKYDDMLCAKIVTNSSNNVTITPLLNKSNLHDTITFFNHEGFPGSVENSYPFEDNSSPDQINNGRVITRNWSRKGQGSLVAATDIKDGDTEANLGVWVKSRYEVIAFQQVNETGANGWIIAGEFKA